MKRVEFRLSMPNRGSWNGDWSGQKQNYVIYRNMTDKKFSSLTGGNPTKSWSHQWNDGWCARVTMREMAHKERRAKSDGFSGYNWMVENILCYGQTHPPTRQILESMLSEREKKAEVK